MSVPMLNAYVEGYQEHLFALQCLTVHQGFWAGYYQSKRPKPVKYILSKLVRDHDKEKVKHNQKSNVAKPEVDVAAFLERERQFKKRLRKGG